MTANATQAEKATDERQQDRLEAYQPLTTGEEIHLRGRGTPEEWKQIIELVDEDETRKVLWRSAGGLTGTQVYNTLIDFAKLTGLVESEPDPIDVGDVVTDSFTGRLLTVTDVEVVEGDRYLSGEFTESDGEDTQTRHVDDVEAGGSQ